MTIRWYPYTTKPLPSHFPYPSDMHLDIAWEVFLAACGQVQLDTAGWHLERIGKMAYIHDASEAVPSEFPDPLGGTPAVIIRALSLMARALEIAYQQMVQIEHHEVQLHERSDYQVRNLPEKNSEPVVE